MTGRTHLLGGITTIWLLRLAPGGVVIGMAVGAGGIGPLAAAAGVGALLPDLDASASLLSKLSVSLGGYSRRRRSAAWEIAPFALPSMVLHKALGHRGAMHSLAGLAAAAWLGLVFVAAGWADWRAAVAFAFGYASHLALDACTPHGIPLLWPRRGRVNLLPAGWRIPTGSSAEDAVFGILAILSVALLISAVTGAR